MSITGCCLIICVLVTEFYLRKGSGPDEDDIAREKLGPRGVPSAPDTAKMTPQEKKNIPKSGEFDGHTA